MIDYLLPALIYEFQKEKSYIFGKTKDDVSM